jgi:hypothetical protein
LTLRWLYTLVGIAWALLLGPLAAIGIVGLAAGVAWLFVYGDDPWPKATEWLLPAIGLAGGAVIFAGCIAIGHAYGRRRTGLPPALQRYERRKGLALLVVPEAVGALLLLKLAADRADYEEAMAAASAREAAFAELLGARHVVAGIEVASRPDGTFAAAIRLAGQRSGDYRLGWRVGGTSFGATLAGAEQVLALEGGERRVAVEFTVDQLAGRYRELVLRGGGGVLVDEPFRLQVRIEPVLSGDEQANLPPGERRRIALGDSPLPASASMSFPVRFVIAADGSIGR